MGQFNLPINTTPQIRKEVVSRIVEAMFRVKHLDYCDYLVTLEGEPSFYGKWSSPSSENIKFERFTDDERKAAFEEFKSKGYHIAKEEWYSSVNCHRLWTYLLRDVKDTPEDRMFTWLF